MQQTLLASSNSPNENAILLDGRLYENKCNINSSAKAKIVARSSIIIGSQNSTIWTKTIHSNYVMIEQQQKEANSKKNTDWNQPQIHSRMGNKNDGHICVFILFILKFVYKQQKIYWEFIFREFSFFSVLFLLIEIDEVKNCALF